MKLRMKQYERVKQQGFVSIIVAATVMILLSLITIGFTRVMQREQREALDRQLTRQATYAAESGINTVWQYIQDNSVDTEKNQCEEGGNVYSLGGGEEITIGSGANATVPSPYFDELDDSAAVQITCVLYDKTPTEFKFLKAQNEETIIPFEDANDVPIRSITITWEGNNVDTPNFAATNCSASDGRNYEFPSSLSNYPPVMKFDLYNSSSYTRNDLANSASYLYLIPCSGGSSTRNITIDNDRNIYKRTVDCEDNGVCSVELDVSAFGSSSFFVRHKLLYNAGKVTLSGININDEFSELKQGQSVIDVTARATDVVRRLRVHVSYDKPDGIPSGVVTVGEGNTSASPNKGLCKDLDIIDNYSIVDNCN